MRVISGKARGRKLKLVPGDSTRPITDRVKENLFNLLGPGYIPGTRWLDLFAGTGQVGIEALSRGAAEVLFLDASRQAVRTIHDNLRHTELETGSRVLLRDAFNFLREARFTPYDVIFVAPPQYKGLWSRAIAIVDEEPTRFLQPDGLTIVQIDPREYEPMELNHLTIDDQRTYGNTMLIFYAPAEPIT